MCNSTKVVIRWLISKLELLRDMMPNLQRVELICEWNHSVNEPSILVHRNKGLLPDNWPKLRLPEPVKSRFVKSHLKTKFDCNIFWNWVISLSCFSLTFFKILVVKLMHKFHNVQKVLAPNHCGTWDYLHPVKWK